VTRLSILDFNKYVKDILKNFQKNFLTLQIRNYMGELIANNVGAAVHDSPLPQRNTK